MKLVYGLVLMTWLALRQIMEPQIDMMGIASLLGMLCLFIVKERFLNRIWSSIVFLAILLVLSHFQVEFLMLLGIPIVDFMYSKRYVYGAAVSILSLIISLADGYYSTTFIFALSGLFGYVIGEKEWNERQHAIVLDDERQLRYYLETTRNELIQSRKEIEHLTRIKERNRIAHEIHDNVGHSIAGVIFQLEAAKRVMNRDAMKLGEILNLCSSKLSEALQLTRRTVYNINTDKKIGPERLEKIVDDFKFCPIHFEHCGSFYMVSASNMEILEKVVMESLTNASKHSRAQHIQIRVEIRSKNIRFYYKDDGVGCSNIHESLGIAGIRERVLGAGGTIAIDGQDGFMMVCHLPITAEDEGEDSIENSNC